MSHKKISRHAKKRYFEKDFNFYFILTLTYLELLHLKFDTTFDIEKN